MLQAAEATLGQLWGIDSAGWPAGLHTKVDQYPKQIQNYVETIAKVKSRPFLATLESELDSAKGYVSEKHWQSVVAEGHPYQRAIMNCDGCYERAAAATQNISSTEGRKTAEVSIKKIRDIALDAKRKQFNQYQAEVVKICGEAFKAYQDTNFTLSPGRTLDPTSANTLATRIFNRSSLATVDQSSLAPETSRLFNDVLSKLTAKMDGDGQFQTQKQIAETPKKKLEEF